MGDDNPQRLFVLRRALETAYTWISERIFKVFCSMPWIISVAVDTRRPVEERRALSAGLAGLAEEQLGEWFGKPAAAKLPCPTAWVDDPDWNVAVNVWSWEVLGSVCQREFQHNRNRQRANSSQSWAIFSSVSTNEEC